MKLHNKIFKSLGYVFDEENSMDGSIEYIRNTEGNIKKISIIVEGRYDTILTSEKQWNKTSFEWEDVDVVELSGQEMFAVEEARKHLGCTPDEYGYCHQTNKVLLLKRRKKWRK